MRRGEPFFARKKDIFKGYIKYIDRKLFLHYVFTLCIYFMYTLCTLYACNLVQHPDAQSQARLWAPSGPVRIYLPKRSKAANPPPRLANALIHR